VRGPTLLLVAFLFAAAACGGREDATAPDGGSRPASAGSAREDSAGLPWIANAGVDGGAGDDSQPNGHLGRGAIHCARCHTDADREDPRWKATAKRLGHNVDQALLDRSTCNCCHLGLVSGFGEPIDRTCVECHEKVKVSIPKMGALHCVSCHDPDADGSPMRETAWECRKCHSEAVGDAPAIDVHGTLECQTCHHPHSEPWTIPHRCADCHAGHETGHGGGGMRAPEGRKARTAPGRPASGTAAVIALLDGGAGNPIAGEAAECSTCHEPHEIAGAAAARCAECHEKRSPGMFARATFEGGHTSCLFCHSPHDVSQGGPPGCTKCHSTIVTMAVPARGSEAHQRCLSCHEQHDVRAAASACSKCHADVHPEHPDPDGRGCAGCHAPHPTVATTPAGIAGPATGGGEVVCSGCHQAAGTDHGFHPNPAGCIGCHQPHAFRKELAVPCAKCHEHETAAAAQGGGHRECITCHTPHRPERPACASCHQQEASSAPSGHAKCTTCHDAHPTASTPKTPCAGCHAAKKAGPHEAQECTQCHRAHGPDTPGGPPAPPSFLACSGCHAPATLGGLHASPGHQKCSGCHTAHTAPAADRATCMACHSDRNHHEPEARACNGCHPFAK
jgi:hypothetical protein